MAGMPLRAMKYFVSAMIVVAFGLYYSRERLTPTFCVLFLLGASMAVVVAWYIETRRGANLDYVLSFVLYVVCFVIFALLIRTIVFAL
jgi:hypothetical protein